jgi:NAD-dependent SIR2 family protein deacetylase
MMAGTVLFLGAGATKSCGGPLTSEILPHMVRSRAAGDVQLAAGHATLVADFLERQFHVVATSPDAHYPGLPLLLSLIDTALDRRQGLAPDWNIARMTELREAVEFAIFDQLEQKLMAAPTNNHWQLFEQVAAQGRELQVISTNYDLIADTAMMAQSTKLQPGGRLPDYRCGISTEFYRKETTRFGVLLKLHGSLNWLYCRTCARLELGASESQKYLSVLQKLVGPSLESTYLADGMPCPVCHEQLRPVLIAPTHLKNYRNPHLTQVWYEAEQLLRSAERVVFIGYSLPDDDVEVVYLLKRSLAHLPAERISIVEFDATNPDVSLADHAVGRRYRTLFGGDVRWWAGGLDAWLAAGANGIA